MAVETFFQSLTFVNFKVFDRFMFTRPRFGGVFFMSAALVRMRRRRYIAPRKVGLDNILANPVRAGTQQP